MNVSEFYAKVGRRLELLRKAAGINQKNMARLLEIDQPAISRTEEGKRHATVLELKTLADFYKIAVDDIVSGFINYAQISERFQSSLPLPRKYLQDKNSIVREILPFVYFVRSNIGEQQLDQVYEELEIEALKYCDASVQISGQIVIDVIKNLLEKQYIGFHNIAEVTKYVNEPCLSTKFGYDENFADNLTAFDTVDSLVKSLTNGGSIYNFSLEQKNKESFLLQIQQGASQRKSCSKKSNEHACYYLMHFYTNLIAEYPRSKDLPSLKYDRNFECQFDSNVICEVEMAL